MYKLQVNLCAYKFIYKFTDCFFLFCVKGGCRPLTPLCLIFFPSPRLHMLHQGSAQLNKLLGFRFLGLSFPAGGFITTQRLFIYTHTHIYIHTSTTFMYVQELAPRCFVSESCAERNPDILIYLCIRSIYRDFVLANQILGVQVSFKFL